MCLCRKDGILLRPINIALDLYSGAVCLILFCYLCFSRRSKDRMRQCFIGMCASSFGMAVGGIPNWAFEGLDKPWYPVVLWVERCCSGCRRRCRLPSMPWILLYSRSIGEACHARISISCPVIFCFR